ncbi:hypothetical protein Clacol_009969 [Clathrus columnatus]|uniref:Uncharacterized protein n=1 Tax=Clathrus columnatus TaxID=1419009 RepID=A0AAV5AM18_9AGAM|nr:hypothetical protein Clacol_009969 [Clathrus columnatus]
MEEDYLEWKEPMWAAFAAEMNVEEGGGDTPDFAVTKSRLPSPGKSLFGQCGMIRVHLEPANPAGGTRSMQLAVILEWFCTKKPSTRFRSMFVDPHSACPLIHEVRSLWLDLVPVVAPFRGSAQERVALARRTSEKAGKESLADCSRTSLSLYGCRKSSEDFYKDEWQQYVDVTRR